jgi:hypothetical protein
MTIVIRMITHDIALRYRSALHELLVWLLAARIISIEYSINIKDVTKCQSPL